MNKKELFLFILAALVFWGGVDWIVWLTQSPLWAYFVAPPAVLLFTMILQGIARIITDWAKR
jgi:hypothetical protein